LGNGKIIVQYDNRSYTPRQISDHEAAHGRENTAAFRKVMNVVKNSLSVTEQNRIFDELYADYKGLENGDAEYILKEFICDVLSGMSEYSAQFADLSNAFLNGGEIGGEAFSPAEYAEMSDAGGFVGNVGFGDLPDDAIALSIIKGADNKPIVDVTGDILNGIPKKQWIKAAVANLKKKFPAGIIINQQQIDIDAQSRREITRSGYSEYLRKNKNALFADKLRATNNVDEILIATVNWINETPKHARSDSIVGFAKGQVNLRVLGNDYTADVLVAIAKNGKAKLYDILDVTPTIHKKKASLAADSTSDDEFRERQEKPSIDIIHPDSENVNSILPENEKNIADVRYSVDREVESLTSERIEEIRKRYDKDRVGIVKPSFREQWGERAAWIAHNISRVFPDIPESGEKGVFFAEFRKAMIQWKALPKTASFMAQDKLGKMTEDLSPKEFKTFGELVYFLDLQEEAKIQLEKGYGEILLPNGITPREVDGLVKVLDGEATDKVRDAITKRRGIWNELKKQYITLNQALGFNVESRFLRENYYRHQVIEFMTDNRDGGTGKRDLGIKAGRGWLKQRQGSTKAINTDFLAVEYQAMLQMQYDTYIANTLVDIMEQYDIKAQLEKAAFVNNKALIDEITAKESNGIFKDDGTPDSGTYERQAWYNKRIMFGFGGLMDLAKENNLPDFDGAYSDVTATLKQGKLNGVSQSKMYKYVGELAGMDTPNSAADEERQPQISARIILKYTSQKKAWVKETLGNKFQTWEDLVDGEHGVFQPRKGNYFYTKEAVDETAFDKAMKEITDNLALGAGFEMTADTQALFKAHADTIRSIGAAYKQLVLPKEIIKTMDSVANPKQASVMAKEFRKVIAMWKGWSTSVNPLRTVKYGIRNLAGDLDAVIAGKPQIVTYAKKAMGEIYDAMKHKKYTPEFMEWVERGGYTSILYANDMDTETRDKLFSHLQEKSGKSIFEIPKKILKGYLGGVEAAHNFREAILRYSAYLYFRDAINKNGVTDYAASNRFIVQGLKSVEDKSYQLSKDLLGAYDEVGQTGQVLRRYWIPFYSFTETNARRYYRLFANIIASDASISKKAGKVLLKSLMANLLTLLLIAWNKFVMPEDDGKLPPSVRARPHITLGSIGDNVFAFTRLGSFSELLEWFGLDDYSLDSEDVTAPVDKAWGMITPFVKLPVEIASGLNFYPELTKPRAIRDRWEHVFDSWGVGDIYNAATGKPTRGIGNAIESAFLYKYDYEESAYYEIQDRKREFQNNTGGDIYRSDAKSNALYYMKAAIRYGDKKAAVKYMNQYFENGGTGKGLIQSFSMLNPMYGFTSKETLAKGEKFVKSLSGNEKEKLKIAQRYYENGLALPEYVTKQLKKKDITDAEAKRILTGYIMTAKK
jgi:hypothetical protein